MNTQMRAGLLIWAAAACWLFSDGIVRAQTAPPAQRVLKLKAPKASQISTPAYQSDYAEKYSGAAKKWLEVSTDYDTYAPWTDELEFTFYVLFRNKDVKTSNAFLLLAGKTSYVNIPRGTSHRAAMYAAPSTLDRYGDPLASAVLVSRDGQVLGIESGVKDQGRWWEKYQPVDGLLLNRLETPFGVLNFDGYESQKSLLGTRR